MPFVRMIVAWKAASDLPEDTFTNTLYFNVSGSVDPPDYNALCTDVAAIYRAQGWTGGRVITVKAYNMADAKPRPIKGQATNGSSGSIPLGPSQVALCLSYYADRNLPRQRGRIFTGPWAVSLVRPGTTQRDLLITMANSLAGVGGLNVDWSVYSPTNGDHTRISDVWVDDSWDIIRSRKLKPTTRTTAHING